MYIFFCIFLDCIISNVLTSSFLILLSFPFNYWAHPLSFFNMVILFLTSKISSWFFFMYSISFLILYFLFVSTVFVIVCWSILLWCQLYNLCQVIIIYLSCPCLCLLIIFLHSDWGFPGPSMTSDLWINLDTLCIIFRYSGSYIFWCSKPSLIPFHQRREIPSHHCWMVWKSEFPTICPSTPREWRCSSLWLGFQYLH